jgi:hypothetical protein
VRLCDFVTCNHVPPFPSLSPNLSLSLSLSLSVPPPPAGLGWNFLPPSRPQALLSFPVVSLWSAPCTATICHCHQGQSCPLSPVPCPLSPVMSPVPCPLSPVLCRVPCALSPVPCPLSPVLRSCNFAAVLWGQPWPSALLSSLAHDDALASTEGHLMEELWSPQLFLGSSALL